MNCFIKTGAVEWNASPTLPLHSSMGQTRQMHEKLSESALDLGPIDFMQIFQGQDNSAACLPTISGEASQEFIGGSASLQSRKQGIDPLALDTANGFCNYFDQASMIKSGGITQGSCPMPITPPLNNWSPTFMPDIWEHQLLKPSKHVNIKHSARSCQIQRRREQNRAAQRAFRARKEKYTLDLENKYGHLMGRYNQLVRLLRDGNADQSGTVIPQELIKEERREGGGESVKEKCRCMSL